MEREKLIEICNSQLKAVRAEYSFNQEKMAYLLGLSKKTLVEIEKGRSSLGWSGSVTLCCIFSDSGVLSSVFGTDVNTLIKTIAFQSGDPPYRKANSTRVWWHPVEERSGYILEQNIVSQHYRLLAPDRSILASSFDPDELLKLLHNIPHEVENQ